MSDMLVLLRSAQLVGNDTFQWYSFLGVNIDIRTSDTMNEPLP